MAGRPAILFVCLGNICRSPLAEGALRRAALDAGLDLAIDSAGTGHWHIGKPPDPRAQEAAARHGVDISGLRARQLAAADYTAFTHILAADRTNLRDIHARRPHRATAEIALMLDVVPGREGAPIADPYYGGEENFEDTWDDVSAVAAALVARFGR